VLSEAEKFEANTMIAEEEFKNTSFSQPAVEYSQLEPSL